LVFCLAPLVAQAQTYTWNAFTAGPYDWTNQTYWGAGSGGYPNGEGVSAVITGDVPLGPLIISLNRDITLGRLEMADTAGTPRAMYITNDLNGSLVFQDTSGTATLARTDTYLSGVESSIYVPVTLSSTLNMTLITWGVRFSGAITGSGGIIKNGAGLLTLTASNSFAGDLVINDGRVLINNNSAMPSGTGKGSIEVNANGVLDCATTAPIINGLRGEGIVSNSSTAYSPVLKIGANSQDSVFSGSIRDKTKPLSIEKQGSGTLTLSGNNTYTGTTSVANGVLLVNGTHSNAGEGKGYAVSGSGSTLGGSGTISLNNASVTFVAGSKLSPGAAPGAAGTLTLALGTGTNNLSAAMAGSSGALVFDLGLTNDKVTVTSGKLAIGTGQLDFGDFAFTIGAGLGGGTHVLLHATDGVVGSLGGAVTTNIAGLNLTLRLDGSDIVLDVPRRGTMISIK
jgi:autotransporter-associated beta strand protein